VTRRADQLVVGGAPGDAIFNEALFLRGILRARGCASEIYADRISAALPNGQALDVRNYQPRAGDTLIFHYSIGSRLNALVHAWPVRLVLIYHNVTPSVYFQAVNPQIESEVAQGRADVPLFRRQAVLALADSEFNRLELVEHGYDHTGVLPLAFTLANRAVPDPQLCETLQDGALNLLFVGRVAPHKKQDDLIRFLYVYRQLEPHARLLLVGSWGGTERYLAWLKSIAMSLGLSDHVIMAGHVSDAELAAYYASAHVFVCLSEHEGFCVPLVEAMASRLPIIAFHSTAVPYTLGDAGIIVREKRWDIMAALSLALTHDENLRNAIVQQQQVRSRAFTPEFVQSQFESYLDAINL
jgi:glycosyltransferase involved in cell wall biosynthesis